jgi:hypothetical protein
MSDKDAQPSPTNREDLSMMYRDNLSALEVAQTVAQVATPVAIMAAPVVAKMVNRPPKPEPPKVELPPGVSDER